MHWKLMRSCCASIPIPSTWQKPVSVCVKMNGQLAAHELVVGSFYNRYGGTGHLQSGDRPFGVSARELSTIRRSMDEALYNLT